MLFPMPPKKMEKVNKFGFIAKCDCGYIQRFKSNEINLSKSNASTVEFNTIYTCPKCGQTYDGIFENITNRSNKYTLGGILISLVLVLGLLSGGYYILSSIFSPSQPTSIDNMTNKQFNEFLKWDHAQQQQKQDNSPAFNNK